MRRLLLLCTLCGLMGTGSTLDRQAFSLSDYNLQVRVDPAQQSLQVEGKVTLRNDSTTAQKNAVLQISSSLEWKSITLDGKPVQHLTQPYVSDLDHTGSLSEAIIPLPREVPPRGTIELEIGYGGSVTQDATRLTRVGTPAQAAARSDWDQISASFTAVRGAGYVAWYPIATEAASLSEGNAVFESIAAWKERELRARMAVHLCVSIAPGTTATLVMNESPPPGRGVPGEAMGGTTSGTKLACRDYTFAPLGMKTPTFVIADYRTLNQPPLSVLHLPGHEEAAAAYAGIAQKVEPLVRQWFGPRQEPVQIIELPDPGYTPYESGAMLFTPLNTSEPRIVELVLVHQLAHASFQSPRPWIYEGLAHFAQALQREQQNGRAAALAYMGQQLPPLQQAERQFLPEAPRPGEKRPPPPPQGHPLATSLDEVFYRTKAMFVWAMLRDMVGEQALQHAIQAYRPEQDKEPSYFQRLLAEQAHRDLEWFFDDWVYRDRGLPDFRVTAVYPRRLLPEDWSVTVTLENLGDAGAEVPVMVRAEQGREIKRLEVHAHETAVTRIAIPALPKQATVNDGSVPESNTGNNSMDIKPPSQ